MGLFKKKQTEEPASREPRTTDKLPLVPFKVVASGIPFYRDEECSQLVEDAQLVVLQALDPSDQVQEYDLVPSTLEYRVGDYVTMNLEKEKLWEDCYFRDPQTKEVQKAWRIHVNFVGAVVDPKVIADNKAHLEQLERDVEAKIEEISQAKSEAQDEPVN